MCALTSASTRSTPACAAAASTTCTRKAKPVPSRNIDRWLVLAGIIVTFDQVSKWLILAWLQPGDVIYVAPFFNWVLTFNPGAAFSFL
ncbi:MAG: signal peptidase II, partial [Accumulibacter sp.]|uniref:signal peptidase II n=1 Tax=Accumulibacter sp. TaxID=2053492 RepID=UPI0033150767